jgi:hypothetical protein
MPRYEITGPDGKRYEVNAPDGASEQDVLAYVQQNAGKSEPAKAKPFANSVGLVPKPGPGFDPTEGMGRGQKFVAGVGKSLVDTKRGAVQFAKDWRQVAPGVFLPVAMTGREEADRIAKQDAPLTEGWGSGFAGNALGTIAQLVGPGGLAKLGTKVTGAAPRVVSGLEALYSAAVPTTVRGGAVQGAALGGLQPVGTGDSRALNTGLGGLLGGAGTGLPQAAGAAIRAVRSSRVTPSGVERQIAQVLRAEADDPARLMAPQPSQIPGVQRTLAEETLDPGIARLERNARSQGRGWDIQDRANNAARVGALEAFAGDSAALRAAQAQRESVAGPLRRQAMQDAGVDTAPVLAAIEAGIQQNAPRRAVASALRDVQDSLSKADGSVRSLYQVRKDIGDLLSGKAGADKSYAKAASKELIQIRDLLDQQIAAKSPAFGQYLDAFRQGSKAVDRIKVGQRLTGKASGGAVLDPVTGKQVLMPASFSAAARDLDAVAAKATGFRKAQAADVLEPADLSTIRNVQDDLERRAFAATAGSGGNSQTFERMALNQRMAGGIASRLPIVGRAFDYLNEVGQARLQARLSEVLANPAQARAILAKLPANDRRVLETAISRAGGLAGGATVPALTE